MKITILTRNKPVNIALVNIFAEISNVHIILEEDPPLKGVKKKEAKEAYKAEYDKLLTFGYFPKYVTVCPKSDVEDDDRAIGRMIEVAEINSVTKSNLNYFLNSDIFIVFGIPEIKGWLSEFLLEKKVIYVDNADKPANLIRNLINNLIIKICG